MKKTLTNNIAFGLAQVLGSIKGTNYKFNKALIINVRMLNEHIGLIQESIKGLKEDEIGEVGLEEVELDFTTVPEDSIPLEISVEGTMAVLDYLLEPTDGKE